MSLILCPECGAKISDKATQCPYCGFQSDDSTRPISEQDKYEVFPFFEYDIKGWVANRGDLSIISYEDNKTFNKQFGRWERIQKELPALAEVIFDMAHKENILEAKMDNYLKELISKGVYRLTVDKNGEILPTIKNGNQFVKMFRLEERTLTPNLAHSLNNLASDEELCNWAINDYKEKTGIIAQSAKITSKEDYYKIALFDDNGNILDVYTVHPKTGIGFNQKGDQVDLPQTGNNSLRPIFIASSSVLLIILGLFAIIKSCIFRRRRDNL